MEYVNKEIPLLFLKFFNIIVIIIIIIVIIIIIIIVIIKLSKRRGRLGIARSFLSNFFHSGFTAGWIKWDDEDDSNRNKRSGTLPDGTYTKDTKIEYCCRRDGFATNKIILPTDSPFILYKASIQCQYVKGMNFREDFFRWDTEDDNTNNQSGGFRPYGDVDHDIKLHYCYYYK